MWSEGVKSLITVKELKPGDIFMRPSEAGIYKCMHIEIGDVACTIYFSKKLDAPYKSKEHFSSFSMNSEFFVRYLRPGIKDTDLTMINMQR